MASGYEATAAELAEAKQYDKLIRFMFPRVRRIVRKAYHDEDALDSAVREGIWRAALAWDPTAGFRFTRCAVYETLNTLRHTGAATPHSPVQLPTRCTVSLLCRALNNEPKPRWANPGAWQWALERAGVADPTPSDAAALPSSCPIDVLLCFEQRVQRAIQRLHLTKKNEGRRVALERWIWSGESSASLAPVFGISTQSAGALAKRAYSEVAAEFGFDDYMVREGSPKKPMLR